MLKISLVYPSYSQMLGTSDFKRFGIYAGAGKIPERPHIGIGYLSESLTRNGYEHDFIDMNLFPSYKDFKLRTKRFSPTVIGLTMVTPGYLHAYKLIRQIKKDFPKSKIIVGGPHVGVTMTQLFKDCPYIDVGFISEAEKSLIDYLNNDCRPEKVKGVIYKKGKKTVFNPPELEEDIDEFGFPRYEKFDLKKYSGVGLYTSRGCPFRCIFCTVEAYRRKRFRGKSVKSVIEEIVYWYGRGQKLFPIEDDNFTLDMDRIFRLCDEIKKLKLKDLQFALGQGIRADRVNRKLLRKMYNVGFKYATIAVEGGNNRVLKNLNKGETIEKIDKAIKDACEIGYEVRLLFVVGAPGETWKDIEDSFKIAKKYPVMYSRFNNLLPIPGTELFSWVEKENLFITPPEKYLNSYHMDYTEPWYETPELTAEERKRAIVISDKINQRLFFNYLMRKLKKIGPIKYPIAFFASRKMIQSVISEHPIFYKFALLARRKII
jgi:radical SAM superfamily enzyme YgiQ (UPF0313 family)